MALAAAVATFTPACAVATRSDPPPAMEGSAVTFAQLDVTDGSLRQLAPGRFEATEPKVRAVATTASQGDAAELRFMYKGPSDLMAPLESGELRRQVGLKLRAEDGCNLVYIMWRIDPEAKLVVSVKRNPGMHTHAECGANGYSTLAPEYSVPMPKLNIGEQHKVSAAIDNGRLLVMVDGKTVWEGTLPDEALSLKGKVGLRTDNAKLDLELYPAAPSLVWGESTKPP